MVNQIKFLRNHFYNHYLDMRKTYGEPKSKVQQHALNEMMQAHRDYNSGEALSNRLLLAQASSVGSIVGEMGSDLCGPFKKAAKYLAPPLCSVLATYGTSKTLNNK